MQRASNIVAALAIGLAVLGLGGVHTTIAGVVAFLALGAACLQVAHQRSREHRVLVSLVGLSMLAASLLCVVQLIPLPGFVHLLFNPTGLDLYETGRDLAGVSDLGWRPVSLDPGETADRAIRYVALAAIAIWAGNLRSRKRWQVFAYGFVPLALVTLGVGYGLWASSATTYFGLYSPTVGFRGPSTFISTNHGAAFYGLAMLVGLAAALRLRHDHQRRAAGLAVASLALGCVALAMDSDGVVVALAAAAVVAVAVQWLRRGRPKQLRKDVQIGVGLLIVLSSVAAIWLDLHLLVGHAVGKVGGDEHLGRLELMQAGAAAVVDFWRFGAGAGSVESVLPAYIDWSVVVAASLPVIENDPLEVLLSFGVPLGLLMISAPLIQTALLARSAVDGQRSPRYPVVLVAGAYLIVIAQLHFPLFTLGISLPALAWFEMLWSRRGRPTGEDRFFGTGHVAVRWRIAAVFCALLGVVILLGIRGHFATYAPAERLEDEGELAHELRLRPASHVPYVKLATAAVQTEEFDRAVKLADHAVTREPSPRVRLYRAQVLARAGDPRGVEAFAELFDEGHTTGRFLHRFLTSVRDAEQRAELLSDHPAMWLDAANRMRRLQGPDAVSSFVVALAELRPTDVEVYRLGATVYLQMQQPVLSELWAELAHDLETSQKTATVEAPLLLARALRASGRFEEARKVLDEAMTQPLLVDDAHRVALELRGAPDDELLTFVQQHHDAYCVSPIPPENQRVCWASEAWLLETKKDHAAAAKAYRRLYRRMEDPLPLARYFRRSMRCDDLLALSRELEPGAPRRAVEALRAKCGQ